MFIFYSISVEVKTDGSLSLALIHEKWGGTEAFFSRSDTKIKKVLSLHTLQAIHRECSICVQE